MTFSRSLIAAASGLALSLVAGQALAHSPYLKPNQFQPDARRPHVTVEASFAEGSLNPDVAMKSDFFHATAPDGTHVPLAPAASLKDATYLEVPLAQTGTYRISSGERVGRVAKGALTKDKTVKFFEGPEAKLEAGETAIEVQSLTRADVYVVHGKASSLPAPANGLSVYPVTAPNDAYSNEAVKVRVLMDGKPLSGEHVTVEAGDIAYAAKKSAPVDVVTDANGEVSFTPATAGLYLIQTRMRRASPDKPGLWLSRTATLTLEVLPQ